MLNKKLQTDYWNEMCYQLLKLMIQKMNIKFRGGLLGLKRLQGFLELLLLRNRSRIGINKWYQSFALRNFDLEDMEFESTNSNTIAKLPILKLAQENGTSVTKMSIPVSAEEKTNKKNDVKARSLLLMALPNEHHFRFDFRPFEYVRNEVRPSIVAYGISEEISQDCIVMPIWKDASYFDSPTKDVENGEPKTADDAQKQVEDSLNNENVEQDKFEGDSSAKDVNAVGTTSYSVCPMLILLSLNLMLLVPSVNTASSNEQDSPKDMFTIGVSHRLEATHIEFFSDEDEPEINLGNITNSYIVPTTPNTRIHKDHPIDNVIGDVKSSVQTRRMTKPTSEQGSMLMTLSLALQTRSYVRDCGEAYKALVKDEMLDDVDVHLYRSMIRSLMYLITSRPDIMFVVYACARFQVTPKTSHLLAVKRIFRYLKGKPTLGLWYSRDSPFELVSYTDSDYAGENQVRSLQLRVVCFWGNRLISWQCKKQTVVATYTTKAKYVAAASFCGQVLLIQNQLLDYWYNFMNTVINIDNNNLLTKGFDAGRFQYLVSTLFEGRLLIYTIKAASSLEAEQDSGSGPRCQDTILGDVDAQTRFEITSKQSNDPPLSRGYTLGSGEDKEGKGKLFMELMEKRRKHFAALGAQEKRNRPPTKAQKRTQMSTYIKHMGGYTYKQFKEKSFDEIQKLYDKEMKRVNTFVAMGSEERESKEKKAKGSEETAKGSRKKMLGRKRVGK
ncbi:hypothetical protein Tco_0273678 [Tanacetum coccineum]